MQHEHFQELQEWSERKHELVIKYLEGFVRILGGSTRGAIYYVDGFAGPGIYDDGAKGSPIRAAEYAQTLSNKQYQLRCINIEDNPKHFHNLDRNTEPYKEFTKNYFGPFADHMNTVLEVIGDYPAIFFLDPFGIKGIEWRNISPVLARSHITEVLLRVKPNDLSRLAGFASSQSHSAAKKRQVLTDLYGFSDSHEWEEVWNERGMVGLVDVYKRRLLTSMSRGRCSVCSYGIKSIEGELKYYLLFATAHPKGAILMSNIVHGCEKCYERDVQEYEREWQEKQSARQLSMLDFLYPTPTEEELTNSLIIKLKDHIIQQFAGKTVSRRNLHMHILPTWFGRITTSHLTRVLEELEKEGKIASRIGNRSNDYTKFVFTSLP